MRPRSFAALSVVVLIVLSGCSLLDRALADPPNGDPKQAIRVELERNIARWESSGIARYAFRYSPMCFCPRTEHVVVVDGPAMRIDGVPVDFAAPPRDGTPLGVPGLFDVVRRMIDGDRVSVTYDPATGVPLTMDADPMANAIDDEFSFAVTEWTLDPPDDRLLGRITTAKGLWDAQRPARYTMSILITCTNCSIGDRTYTMQVRDGDAVVTLDGHRVDPEELEGIPVRVESLFEIATWSATHARVTLDFDPQLGYPKRIAVAPDPTGEASDGTYEVVSFTIP